MGAIPLFAVRCNEAGRRACFRRNRTFALLLRRVSIGSLLTFRSATPRLPPSPGGEKREFEVRLKREGRFWGSFEQRGCANREAAPRCSNPRDSGGGLGAFPAATFLTRAAATFQLCTPSAISGLR